MRVLLACLIVLGAFAGSGFAFALIGAGKVESGLEIEMSCRLLRAAEDEGMLTRSERFEVIKTVAASTKLRPPARKAAARLRTDCPKAQANSMLGASR